LRVELDLVGEPIDLCDLHGKIDQLRPDAVIYEGSPTPQSLSILQMLLSGPNPTELIINPKISPYHSLAQRRRADLHSRDHSETAEMLSSGRSADGSNRLKERVALSDAKGRFTKDIIAIGASTGGTIAIAEVLRAFPLNAPATVIVQHMPPGFTKSFANHLNGQMKIEVREAEHGDRLRAGLALIAPGGHHMAVVQKAGGYQVEISATEPVNRHRPSVDVLFDSIARIGGARSVAAILTGMGADGADGLARLHDSGARTVAQDEKSCVVFGMPREAILRNAADFVLPLSQIGSQLIMMSRGSMKAYPS
jgi:two-component system chemotaxis response regulator CheB